MENIKVLKSGIEWLEKKEEIWKSNIITYKKNIDVMETELEAVREIIACLEEQPNKGVDACEIKWLRKEAELIEQRLTVSRNRISDYEMRLKNAQEIIAWLEGQSNSEADCPMMD